MTRRVRDLLARRSTDAFVGREEELAALLGTLGPGGPLIVHLHGIAGIGKSSLIEAFAARARGRRATVVRLDCRAIEPTARGFIHDLTAAIGGDATTPDKVASRLARLGGRVVLVLDNYEVFRLLDTWLRQVFVPALRDNVRVILAGREPPVAAWLAAPGWQGLFRSLTLGPLPDPEAIELLRSLGVEEADARRINRFARGHPLALLLATSAVAERPDLDLEEAAVPRVVAELTQVYLADVPDRLTRQALEAASAVRRVTLPLLRALLPGAAPQDAFDRLRGLPFVETGRDGLIVHEAVKQAVAGSLKTANPGGHQAYRRAAWQHLRSEARTASGPDLWRYTADILYLIENPVVREAFFPSGVYLYAVEPARPDDGGAIHAIVKRHERTQGAKALDAWWSHLPASFHVVRGRDGACAGFYCMTDAAAVTPALCRADSLTHRWSSWLRRNPVAAGERVLFLRRWLSDDHGEAPSPVQAACWLDVKRHYMELRPHLRRIVTTVRGLAAYAPTVQTLCFRTADEANAELDGTVYHAAVLDFGPRSVDGWLADLVTAELGVEDSPRLDAEARELVIGGRRVGLTPRELDVMRYLWEREGKIVTRAELLDHVWEPEYEGGSNVVDVVIRGLRKKLGAEAPMVATVRGAGYRLRRS